LKGVKGQPKNKWEGEETKQGKMFLIYTLWGLLWRDFCKQCAKLIVR
jgi:hypothetical protein